MKFTAIALAGALAVAGAGSANAVTFDVTYSFVTDFNLNGNFLQTRAVSLFSSGLQTPDFDFTSRDLNLGDTEDLNLFVIRTLQTAFQPLHTTAQAFEILFDVAGFGSASVTGTTFGSQDSAGVTQGNIVFDGPAIIRLNSTDALFITLADTSFNAGIGGYTPGRNNGAFVEATLSVQAIPVPAALPLFLSALGLLGFLGRRRQEAAAA